MACGQKAKPCGGKSPAAAAARSPGKISPIDRQDGHGVRISLDVVRAGKARRAICAACPHRGYCAAGGVMLKAHGATHGAELECPVFRWPDDEGVCHRGFRWRGVPFPERVRAGMAQAWEIIKRHAREGSEYPGCGCLVGLEWLKPYLPWGSAGWRRKLKDRSR